MSRQNIIFLLVFVFVLAGAANQFWPRGTADQTAPQCTPIETGRMVAIPAGTLLKGSNHHEPEEAPVHETKVAGFSIQAHEVTNRQYKAFVDATGYRTVAERGLNPADYPGMPAEFYQPASMVFYSPDAVSNMRDIGQWWRIVPGADWQHPEGPHSSLEGRWDHPVVHVTFADALAYAQWRGEDLPTEEEWEWAARGGLVGKDYSWGDQQPTKEKPRANHWQGVFPLVNLNWDGHIGTAPVGCFEPNGYGLYDTAGNVWELTRDRYPSTGEHVIKGGSYLCADNFCGRYRPAARERGAPDGGTNHIGFRTVKR